MSVMPKKAGSELIGEVVFMRPLVDLGRSLFCVMVVAFDVVWMSEGRGVMCDEACMSEGCFEGLLIIMWKRRRASK